jgi:hypothetical protein
MKPTGYPRNGILEGETPSSRTGLLAAPGGRREGSVEVGGATHYTLPGVRPDGSLALQGQPARLGSVTPEIIIFGSTDARSVGAILPDSRHPTRDMVEH